MTAPDILKLRARIRALLAKTVEAGCTEAEAETAAARARELMREHGLTEDNVLGFEIVELRVQVTKKPAETDCLIGVIATACSCESWFAVGDKRHAVYYGHEPDTLIADYMHAVVFGSVERARIEFRRSPEYKRRRSPKTRNAAMQAFVKGFVDGLYWKLFRGPRPDQERLTRAKAALKARAMNFQQPKEKKEKPIAAAFESALAYGAQRGRAVDIHTGMGSSEPTRQIGFRGGDA